MLKDFPHSHWQHEQLHASLPEISRSVVIIIFFIVDNKLVSSPDPKQIAELLRKLVTGKNSVSSAGVCECG